MKHHRCPKCNSVDVHQSNNLGRHFSFQQMALTASNDAVVDVTVCSACGYAEIDMRRDYPQQLLKVVGL